MSANGRSTDTTVPFTQRRRLKRAAEAVRHEESVARRYGTAPRTGSPERSFVRRWLTEQRSHIVLGHPKACPRTWHRCGVCKQLAYLTSVLAPSVEDSRAMFGRRIAGWTGAIIVYAFLFAKSLDFFSTAARADGPGADFLLVIAGALAVAVLLALPLATKDLIEATPASGPGLPLSWDRPAVIHRQRLQRLLGTIDAALNGSR